MPNRIEGYIGCPECKTALFRQESVPGTNPGVREHNLIALGDAAAGASHCPKPDCGAVLTRVPGPE